MKPHEMTPEEFAKDCMDRARARLAAKAKAAEARDKTKQDAREARGQKVVFPRVFSEMEIARRQAMIGG
jgi:hypothetical protein